MILFAKRFKELRKKAGMTQGQLGDKLLIKKSTICKYEKGDRMPSIETFLEIANFFEVDLYELLGYDQYVVAQDKENYGIMLGKEDINIIKEIRKRIALYEKMLDNPKRVLDVLEKKIN